MKCLVKSLLISSALVCSNIAPTFAADDDADIDILNAPESSLVEFGSGWYLRGDVSFNVNAHRITSTFADSTTLTIREIDNVLGFSGAAGYQFTNNFRLEGSIEHIFEGDATSFTQLADVPLADEDACDGYHFDAEGNRLDREINNCSQTDAIQYNAWLFMANGYYDLGKFGNFEPYIGAGVGIARVQWEELAGSITCTPVNASVAPEGCYGNSGEDQPALNEIYVSGGDVLSGTDYRFAYSLTAGFGYRFNDRMLMDLSYKYLGVGADGISETATAASTIAQDGFSAHQIRLGLRYEIW